VANRILLVFVILVLAAATNLAQCLYQGTKTSVDVVWSSQVIFGFYFVILALSVQGLQPSVGERDTNQKSREPAPLQRLFLLVLICLCSDIVFTNYQEATRPEPGYYSLIVLWDIGVFFLWLRAVDLASKAGEERFFSSPLVAVAPILKFGREGLLIPYSHWCLNPCATDTLGPYLDLIFGDLAVCCWLLVALAHKSPGSLERWSIRAVCFGCVYWAIRAAENLLGFAAPRVVVLECERWGFHEFYVPLAFAAVAVVVVAVAEAAHSRVGVFFGLVRHEGVASAG